MNNHSHLVESSLIYIGKNFPNLIMWKQHSGSGYSIDSVDSMIVYLELLGVDPILLREAKRKLRFIKYGLEGSGDLTGIDGDDGTRVEIELKTGTGRQSDAQKRFEKMILAKRGKYILVRELSDIDSLKK